MNEKTDWLLAKLPNVVCFNHECNKRKECFRYHATGDDFIMYNFTPEGANCVGFLDYPEMYKFLIK